MNTLEIRLVKDGEKYIGADVSSRFNLITLFGTYTIGATPLNMKDDAQANRIANIFSARTSDP